MRVRAEDEAKLIIQYLPHRMEKAAKEGENSIYITDTDATKSEEYFYALRDALSGYCDENGVRTDVRENLHRRHKFHLHICWG